MKKAYIVLAHKNENQLTRLIDRLEDGNSHIFIHIDARSNLIPYKVQARHSPHITLVKSISTRWAGFGLVQATLNAMNAIQKSKINFERIILLSGQDYPIKSTEFINDFYKASPYRIFMTHASLPDYVKWVAGGGMYRINKYYFGLLNIYKYAAKSLNLLSSYVPALKRRLPLPLNHYHGSQWWTMDTYAMNYILEYVEKNPAYTAFHKYTFAPDELFFQTILLNSADPLITDHLLNDNNMFMKWRSPSSAHPYVLKKENFTEIAESIALFARKFDPQMDESILNKIDSTIVQSETALSITEGVKD